MNGRAWRRDRGRRRGIEDWLADYGLLQRPRRAVSLFDEDDGFGARLRQALGGGLIDVESRRLFCLFGRYLAGRADLFPASECLQLAKIPDEGVAMPPKVVYERLSGELESRQFESFEGRPFRVKALEQWHRARLDDRTPVIVRISHLAAVEALQRDLGLLGALAPVLGRLMLEEAVVGFRRSLLHDLLAQTSELDLLAGQLAPGDGATVPEVIHRLTTASVAVVEDLGSGNPLVAGETGVGGNLTRWWLRQALASRTFPVAADVESLRDGRLAILGGEFSRLPVTSQRTLWEYLRATAAQRPDEACEHLVRELRPGSEGADEAGLQLRLRQVVPFRDGCWTERGDTVAEHLMLHWRIARESGFEPRLHLQAFYRGVFWVARMGRQLAPQADLLREAVDEFSWVAGWSELRQWMAPGQLAESLRENLEDLLELPRKLDRVLEVASGEGPSLRVQMSESDASRRKRNSTATVISLGLLMATVVVLASQAGAGPGTASWIEHLAVLVFALLGVQLLRAAGRTRRS